MSKLDFGPLQGLIGNWKGDKGIDIAPEPDGEEKNPYYETISFSEVGEICNADSQELFALHYLQRVSRKSDNEVFHHQTGYWMWEPASATVIHSFTIPRAVSVLAAGRYQATGSASIELELHAALDDVDWKIIESPFMRDNASSHSFRQLIRLQGDELYYEQTSLVDIYGKRFEHTEQNQLQRDQ